MKLGLKFGFKMLLRNPVRVAASLLAAIAAFGIAGMCIFMHCRIRHSGHVYLYAELRYAALGTGAVF